MNLQKKLDTLAITFSVVCAIHCFLTPFILVLFPLCAAPCCSEHSNFHEIMVYIVLPTSSISFFLGCRQHKKTSIVTTGVIGLAVITFCAFWGHSTLGELGEKIFTTIGGATLAFAHLRNFQLCKCCKKGFQSPENHHNNSCHMSTSG